MLNSLWGYKISHKARIGFSIIVPENLEMHDYARIGHLTICKSLQMLKMEENSRIGNLNWITAFDINNKESFSHRVDRETKLAIGKHTAITHRHIIDCTEKITIGSFTTIAGYGSQFLTHSIDIHESKQDCKPITIGSYCMVGTACVALPGSSLGDYCILGANSLLNKNFSERYRLYGGVPATEIKKLSEKMQYFSRETGYIF